MLKKIVFTLLLLTPSIFFAQSAEVPAQQVPKIYNLTFTDSEINSHYTNLEGIKLLLKKPGERTYNEVTSMVSAVDSLERNIIKYMKVQVDAEKVEAEKNNKTKK